ncbi:MAG: hypothetical protein IPH05_04045 [Flavobacteriales bacterium]|jgi:hypothetical protein|nr:hypothetical protein [Flavobacteriales bacterium]MBK6551584.1 hypothetical protein [Flavobacteriales bacterium]MBK6882111.1 hypothetical protein [Flavobacteriales bacterium]MBK7101669.1 hypothetical protein [Flavobacteriales bacterium]MBK7112376.1 hypothetical protein [Flavobacteriales bacterium]
MPRSLFYLLVIAALLASCRKEVKEYKATLEASCYDCIVQYAAGSDRGLRDTLAGSVNTVTGDTFVEVGRYDLVMHEEEAIFFRACRIRPDSAYGDITLHASGDISPLSATADRNTECAVINQPVQFK